MLLFVVYTAIFAALIYRNNFFGLFRHPNISRPFLLLIFTGKVLAVPVFYLVYQRVYGGIDNFDTGKFFHDAQIINASFFEHPRTFFRIMFGLQDDVPGSADYDHVLRHTLNWDNGTVKDYLYNDNRVVIRLHALLAFLAFGSWPVQALFSCVISFIGVWLIFKSFAETAYGKERLVLLVLCFFPALWFYTGSMGKEGLGLLVMGLSACGAKLLWTRHSLPTALLLLLPALFVSLLLKPYLLLVFLGLMLTYFGLLWFKSSTRQILVFVLLLIVGWLTAEALSRGLKHRGLAEAALEHQKRFEAVSHGGLFLSDSLDYVQLPADSSLVKRSVDRPGMYQIRKGVSFMYWKAERPRDTLYCRDNQDTLKHYGFIYFIPPSRSNLHLDQSGSLAMAGSAVYYALFYPLFYNASGLLQWLASAENLAILFSLVWILVRVIRDRKLTLLQFMLLVFIVWICLLVGISAPNSGAIFRYRAPAVVFLPLLLVVSGWSLKRDLHRSH